MDWRRLDVWVGQSMDVAQAEPALRFAWAARAFAERVERDGVWSCATDRAEREARAVVAGRDKVAQIRHVAPILAAAAFDGEDLPGMPAAAVKAAFERWSRGGGEPLEPLPEPIRSAA